MMNSENLADRIDHALELYLPGCEAPALTNAMRYCLFAGGKRLRPRLLIASCRMFGGDEQAAMPFACAIEMIHTYSLIHDDLPAMDNDDFRRGKPSCHKQFGEALAILAGDALLNRSFEVMAEACAASEENAVRRAKAMACVGKAAGAYGMVGGQALDINNAKLDESGLARIYDLKTGGLIRAAIVAGYLIATVASDMDIKDTITQVATKLGYAFQIRDDYLDVIKTTKELGKPQGSDAKNSKTTYVTLFGLWQTKQTVNELVADAIRLLNIGAIGFNAQAAPLMDIASEFIISD
ncbi:MAG: polyprenyl synthetase family protein [Clostridiales bacterium]|nr:polyprenyl synthetase family protein [Clostridiales bacterium]